VSLPPPAGPPPSQLPDPGSVRCPRCSSPVGPEQDWCLECGAPARTRLAPTPNWQLPTVAIAAIVLLAGALLAFAFVKLTDDDNAPTAGTTPTAVVDTAPPAVVPPPAVTTTPAATTTAPVQPVPPATTVPGQTAPATTTPATTVPPAATTTPAATPPGATTTLRTTTTP
jgi:hypothetical protein